eukprot:1154800-Pelagomonas_calceolata.AAC.2
MQQGKLRKAQQQCTYHWSLILATYSTEHTAILSKRDHTFWHAGIAVGWSQLSLIQSWATLIVTKPQEPQLSHMRLLAILVRAQRPFIPKLAERNIGTCTSRDFYH